MVLREEDYNEHKIKEERKTAEDQNDEEDFLCSNHISSRLPQLFSEQEMIEVSGFKDIEDIFMMEAEMDEQWQKENDLDDIFEY